jgi:4-alpha-glucanotransferase
MVPLFSIACRTGWGIGEIPDLIPFARWMARAGLRYVQLLPVNEMQEGQNSPYSALSAMAIDPIFIALSEVEDFRQAGGEDSLDHQDRVGIQESRASAVVDYAAIRAVKGRALRAAFARFIAEDWNRGSDRDRMFRSFRRRERWWLEDYALFRALHDEHHACYWLEWEPPLRDREPDALTAARARLSEQILYFQYLQWLADDQWQRVRRQIAPLGILGDFPFMVSGHSADVWARQCEFRVDASVGVPPDAFSETGQDWGLPVYRWDVVAAGGYEWLRQRARRCEELFDGYRVDHLVGFYRTYVRERDGATCFIPPDEESQRRQGEALLALFRERGALIIAEDLGTVPDFVRESMAALEVPGLKVLRWEREWDDPEQPFRDPGTYPEISVATSGTHDTDTMAEWWIGADPEERQLVLDLPALRDSGCDAHAGYSDRTRDALLGALSGARSSLVLLPLQDVFGWRDRINTPASIGTQNWTWRLPWPVEDLLTEPAALERAEFLQQLARRHDRATIPNP